MTQRMPALFIGHGSPLNAVTENRYSGAWAEIGRRVPTPTAILVVSAHWYVPGVRVTAMQRPRTIHDFGGFPQALYNMQYPAPGDPALAQKIAGILSPAPVVLDTDWGLDHGTWSVLCHVFPEADIPVLQLSINTELTPAAHYELGQRLSALRDAGILIIGSGNVVHNLQRYAWRDDNAAPQEWAQQFENAIVEHLEKNNDKALIDYPSMPGAELAIPTPEHYLPLLYIAALRHDGESVSLPLTGIAGGSISMLSMQVG